MIWKFFSKRCQQNPHARDRLSAWWIMKTEPSEQICLSKEGRREHNQCQERLLQMGGYQLELSDGEPGCSSLTTDPSSWCAALLGWMYKIPGSVTEYCKSKPRPSRTAPATSLQKKHHQEQCNSRKRVLAGRSSIGFQTSNRGWAPALQLFPH